jgi:hypothetical protein
LSQAKLPQISHLHTYFLFPFSIDKDAVRADHGEIWSRHPLWVDGIDDWISAHNGGAPVAAKLGCWKRAAYSSFDIESPAYQDMVFFHPFVRRVFFDTMGMADPKEEAESLLRFYVIEIPEDSRLMLQSEDSRGRKFSAEITALRLVMFANGIGILSISIECENLPGAQALWINEMMRKVYPSSGRQLREARMPRRQALAIDTGEGTPATFIAEESWEDPAISNYQPPLSKVIKSLLYFSNYERQEYEPVLDERMIVYSYLAIDPRSVPENYQDSSDYQVFLSRALYVDRAGPHFRYDPRFLVEEMAKDVYRRWAHQGTYYGFSAYSNVTTCLGNFDCDDHSLREGFLIHRMFKTRYYLMAVIALFYRATLLDLNERTALISKRLYRDFHDDREFRSENIDAANSLLFEFLHFANFWHFDELANKDEEQDHFEMQCRAFRIQNSLNEVEQSVRRLNSSLNEYYEGRQMAAVNRLGVLSLIFGSGAMLTGFFGMNFGGAFRDLFFEPGGKGSWLHTTTIVSVAVVTLLAFAYGAYLVGANWQDYRDAANPRSGRKPLGAPSVKRTNV